MHATRRHRPTYLLSRVPGPLFTLSSTPSSGLPWPRCARRRPAYMHAPIIAFLLLVTVVLGAQPSLAQQTQPEDAIEAYNKALSIKPDYAEAYNSMGIVLQEQSKLEEAI